MSEITDGQGTTLTLVTSDVTIRKMRVKTPGVSGGGKLNKTGLENTTWRTFSPKTLKELTNAEFEGYWDPAEHLGAPVNTNQLIRITYPAGDKIEFWGFLDSLDGVESTEGNNVNCTGIIMPTCRNGSGVETDPVYSAS
jgi:hypothetical protein